jgi:hypothetical protein
MQIAKEILKSIRTDKPKSRTAFASELFPMYSSCYARQLLAKYIREHNLTAKLRKMKIHENAYLLSPMQMELITNEMMLDAERVQQELNSHPSRRNRRRRKATRPSPAAQHAPAALPADNTVCDRETATTDADNDANAAASATATTNADADDDAPSLISAALSKICNTEKIVDLMNASAADVMADNFEKTKSADRIMKTNGMAVAGRIAKCSGMAVASRTAKDIGMAVAGRTAKDIGMAVAGRTTKDVGIAVADRIAKDVGIAVTDRISPARHVTLAALAKPPQYRREAAPADSLPFEIPCPQSRQTPFAQHFAACSSPNRLTY